MPARDKHDDELNGSSEALGVGSGGLTGATTRNDVTQEPGPSTDPDVIINGSGTNNGLTTPQTKRKNEAGTDSTLSLTQTEDTGGKAQEADGGTGVIEQGSGQPFQYSWDTKAESAAKTQLGSDVITAENEYVSSAQQLAQTAREYQTQADMAPYVDAQNAEKVGWTGGYVLDQQRQTEYLKASIQAQLYGAMELQRYGYDSALAAARLSYDLNMKAYAEEYYNNAVNVALQEGQLTGTYVSAEYRDMISQYNTARAIAGDGSATQEDKDRANNVISSIKGWLSANGVSEAAFDAMGKALSGIQKTLAEREAEWEMYDSAIKAGNSQMEDDPSLRFAFNEDGTIRIDETTGQPELVNMDTISVDDLKEYVKTKQGEDSFYSYMKTKIVGTIQNGFLAWGKTNGYITYDDNGNMNKIVDIENVFKLYLKDTGVLDQFKEKMEGVDSGYAEDWKFQIALADGTQYTMTYDQLKNYGTSEKPQSNNGQTSSNGENETQNNNEQSNGRLKWKTYDWINGGVSPSMSAKELRELKVGRADGKGQNEKDRWSLSDIVGREIGYMQYLVEKTNKIKDGTLFWLERGTANESHESYLIQYIGGKYYIVSNDDNEQAGGENDTRYNGYTGPKMKISVVEGRKETGGTYGDGKPVTIPIYVNAFDNTEIGSTIGGSEINNYINGKV